MRDVGAGLPDGDGGPKLGEVRLHFARYSNLVGGVLLVGIGVLLLVRPEWLSFG